MQQLEEDTTHHSVSVSVSLSESQLSDTSNEMLESALSNLHKIAGEKAKEKNLQQKQHQESIYK